MTTTDRQETDTDDPAERAVAEYLEKDQQQRREEAKRRAIFPE
jgi:hypothetical protein